MVEMAAYCTLPTCLLILVGMVGVEPTQGYP